MDEFTTVVELVNKGGDAALLACLYFIWKAASVLQRIEKALAERGERIEQKLDQVNVGQIRLLEKVHHGSST